MNIHEYQAKALLREHGIATPRGKVAQSATEAMEIARELSGNLWAIKAQVHAGGRGKAGGVKIARNLNEVYELANLMIGSHLITPQTGKEGKEVHKVYVEEGLGIAHEYYLGIVLDRSLEMPIMMASKSGGMEIEEIATSNPNAIIKVAIDPMIGFRPFYARKLAFALGIKREKVGDFVRFCTALFELFLQKDAEVIEINPLIFTTSSEFVALDAKISFDNNALYRLPDVNALRDLSEEEPSEIEAGKHKLSYVKLSGNVGCMVNGAGLAMATMDIIKHEGGEPANFLDVGGGASAESVARGFEIILKDRNVKSIFVNIFGGIVRCDRVAMGIIEATKLIHISLPVVVRLDGTNAQEARKILEESGLENLISVKTLKEGAQKAIKAAGGRV
ncbi:MAG: ADP-forming succinate--CoA ligase subunit beta [Wolinella sp.]